MKRKLSLVLAIAMLASCLLGLTAFAAENDTTENAISYKDVTIAYSNVSYIDEISLMFAVPVPADLPKDSSVSVIVWDEYSDELEFSYDETIADGDNDAPAKLIAANADTASINGVEHFVFEFKDFGPEKMTDVIYARSVIVDANGRRFYGDVITHSILKHVKTALGELRGFTGIADEDTKQLLRDLLDFGADAQDYYGGAAAYLPNGYYANDDVKQIWIVPVINGVEQDKVFGGFFKPGQGNFATLNPLVYDGYEIGDWYNSKGEQLDDADTETAGFQIAAPAGNFTVKLTAEIKNEEIFKTNFSAEEAFGDSYYVPSERQFLSLTGTGLSADLGYGPEQAAFSYQSYTVVTDKDDNKVLRWTGTGAGALWFTEAGSSLDLSQLSNVGDTVAPVFTFELELGGGANGVVRDTGALRIRSDVSGVGAINFNIMSVKDGRVMMYRANGAPVAIAAVPSDGYVKVGFVVDFVNSTIKAYLENNGVMTCVKEEALAVPANFTKAQELGVEGCETVYNWAVNAQSKVEWFGGENAPLNEIEQAAVVELGESLGYDYITNPDGTDKTEAFIKYCETYKSIYIKSASCNVGNVYLQK